MVSRAFGCLLLFLLLAGGCGGNKERARPAAGPTLTTTVARELDAKLREKVKDTLVPGASAAVVFPDGRVWKGAAGVAVIEPRRPMTSQTSLPFASTTKIATAALAMRLVEQGRLSLDDPIERWYAAWRGDPKATIRDLLGHTAGLGDPPDAFFERLSSGGAATPRRFIAATPKPGPRTTNAEYSNTGFMIAGLILARAADRPVAAAMRQELFSHSGGDGLAFQPAERPHPPLAHAYWHPDGTLDRADAADGSGLLPFRGDATMAFTAGALAGDVPSLARWSHELLSGRILKPESLREMTRFHDGGGWRGYGLGLARGLAYTPEGNHELWGHGGEITGSITDLWHLPRKNLTIAIAWNDDRLNSSAAEFLPALLRAALGSDS
jgi:D-alanyl-D-alanine carboxypeptidase